MHPLRCILTQQSHWRRSGRPGVEILLLLLCFLGYNARVLDGQTRLAMKSKQEILSIIRSLQGELRQRFKVKEIGVFGSVVREEQRQSSDIDVLVDFEEGADLFDLVGLGLFLEEKLGQKVDVVPKRALREEIRGAVLKEVVNL